MTVSRTEVGCSSNRLTGPIRSACRIHGKYRQAGVGIIWLYGLGVILFLLGMVVPAMTHAADSSESLTIIITGGRLEKPIEQMPAAVSVLNVNDLRDGRQELGLDEALASVPGVFATNRYNFAQDLRLSIRGVGARASFGIRGLRILIDGMPATTPDGQSSTDDIDLSIVRRMEIIRGPAGALYGPSAGGVLNLETARGGEIADIESDIKFGAYGHRDTGVKSGGMYGPLSYAASISRMRFDGYRAHSAVKRDLFNGRVDYSMMNGGELNLVLALLDAPMAQDAGGLSAEQVNADRSQAAPISLRFDTGETVRQQRVGLRSRHPLDNGAELRLRGYFVARDFSNRLPFNMVELDRRFGGGGVDYAYDDEWLGSPGRSLFGIDLDYQKDRRKRLDNIDGARGDENFSQNEDVLSQGVFLNREQILSDSVSVELGLRHDQLRIGVNDHYLDDGDDTDSVRFEQWSPSLAVLLHSESTIQYYSRIATAFEIPTTTELSRPDGKGGLNPNLDAERSVSYELGMRARWRKAVRGEVAIYETRIEDQLVPFEIAGSPGRYAYENAGRSHNRGLEAVLSLGYGSGWGAQLAYTYTRFIFSDFVDRNNDRLDGKRLPGVPDHLLNVALRYRTAYGLSAVMETRYTGPYYADNANRVQLSETIVNDLRLRYQHDINDWRIHLSGGINNLFDVRYYANIRLNANAGRYYEPAPPRHAYLALGVSHDI